MNKKFYIAGFAALAAGALASCSNDNEPNPGNGSLETVGFVSVNIMAPNGSGTRATEGGAVDGTGNESTVNSVTFLMFDANGNQVGTPQTPELTWTGTSSDPNVEKISNAVLLVEGSKDVTATQILAIANVSDNLDGKTLQEVMKLSGNYDVTDSGFIMSNSVYNSTAGSTVCAAQILGHVSASEEAAKANPVDIYVERVLAKVTTTAMNQDNVHSSEIEIDGAKVTVTPVIKGVEIANVAAASNLFKDIDGISYTWNWNDPANFRSYWANTSNDKFTNQSWTAIGNTPATEPRAFYAQENTGDTKTSVLVTAQFTGSNGEPVSFVKYAGFFYTPDGAMNIMANVLKNNGYSIKTTGADNSAVLTAITPANLKWAQPEDVESWQTVAQLDTEEGTVFVKGDEKNNTVVDASEINNLLKGNAYRVKFWNDGMAYWYVDIEHFGTDNGGNALKGIVRNHVYELTLNSLKGLGVPVFNPGSVIIPADPKDDENVHLAARIKVLKWKVVNQNVDFGK